MANPKKPPSGTTASMLDWRARQIDDPVARLKFLRKSAATTAGIQKKFSKHQRMAMISGVVALSLVIAVPVVPRLWSMIRKPAPAGGSTAAALNKSRAPKDVIPDVWQVEKADGYEVYSNGLRLEIANAAVEGPRRYVVLDRKRPGDWKKAGLLTNYRTTPAGIVFHTTESHIVPFESSQSQNLKKLGENLVDFIRQKRAYHYVIDRFGRVHRAVSEDSIANHAGWSVWADRDSVYLNLNHSFLAIAFEAQTRPQDGSDTINQAQIHAGRVLTDMLRAKYKIRGENCTTHSQVSVNPGNWLIGAHTDWATNFPYEEMGLPDNYLVPIPAITVFGFAYDPAYVQVSEARLWKGLLYADDEIRQAASAQNLKVSLYKAILNQRYKETIEALNLK